MNPQGNEHVSGGSLRAYVAELSPAQLRQLDIEQAAFEAVGYLLTTSPLRKHVDNWMAAEGKPITGFQLHATLFMAEVWRRLAHLYIRGEIA